MRIGIVAGEASGDQLGASLIRALQQINPNIQFEGIAGSQMIRAGCTAHFPMERLSVMGLWEVLGRLPELLNIRRKISQHFLANPPDVFIGIDAPDFNLPIETKFKAAGIPVVHYVSPTVWAWRKGRLKKIARAVDLMLTLLPFEVDFYRQNSNINAQFVGHPLADEIPLQAEQQIARDLFAISADKTVIALLPGSRANEINYLGAVFLQTALWCAQRQPNLIFIAPMVNDERRAQFVALQQKIAPQLNIKIIAGQAQQAMAAADAVLLASGTATIEAMLLKCPMVVAYRMSALTYFIAQRLIKTPYIALPNLLANKKLVPEFIQHAATAENLGAALLNYLENPQLTANLRAEFTNLHQQMRGDASARAAHFIMELLCHSLPE